MSGPDPQAPDYDYRVKNPPQLPPFFQDSVGVKHPTVWSQHAKYHVARYNQDNTGFDVAVEDVNTTHWPYHLGDPGTQPLIRKWGLQILEAAGFINHQPEAGDRFPDAIGRMARTRNPLALPDQQIHPVSRKNMFWWITDEDYELLKPALILASAILDDPITLHFFYALSHEKQWSWVNDQRLGRCRAVKIPQTLTQAEQTAANKKVMDMVAWTSWEVRDHRHFSENTGLACTDVNVPPSYVPNTPNTVYQTKIILSPQWAATLKAFDNDVGPSGGTEYDKTVKEILDLAGIPDDRRPGSFHLASAIMRVNLKLAATMLHEFGHAFVRAYIEGPLNGYIEPWISGNRSNEIGCALEDYIFGGRFNANVIYSPSMIRSVQHSQGITSPFGFHFVDPWDAIHGDTNYGERVLSQPTTHAPAYPVPQRYIYKTHTAEMWQRRVPRYGLNALKLPKLVWWSTLWQ